MPAIYILTNKKNGTLYTGVTSVLITRIYEHKHGAFKKSFSSRYALNMLVYYDTAPTMMSAIQREKAIKAGSRLDKIKLINAMNPEWRDLFDDINQF